MIRRFAGISAVILIAGVAGAFALSPANSNASAGTAAVAADSDKSWIAKSNEYASLLIEIEKKHSPESASHDGLKQYDELVSIDTHEDDVAENNERRAALNKLKAALSKEQDKYVRQDLEIMIHSTELALRGHDYAEEHLVTYQNASAEVFQGLQVLLDDQVSADRRPAAIVRLRKYAGLEPGTTPTTDQLKKLMELQMAKPNMIYPSRSRVETALSRNGLYIDGIASLFKKYNLQGWEEPYAKLKAEVDRVRRLDQGDRPAQSSSRFPPAAGVVCPESGKLWHRHSARRTRGDGSQGFHRISGRNANRRGADRQAARLAQQRLSRRHQAAEAGSARRRQHPSLLQRAPQGDRRHHRQTKSRQLARPACAHSHRYVRPRARSSLRRTWCRRRC